MDRAREQHTAPVCNPTDPQHPLASLIIANNAHNLPSLFFGPYLSVLLIPHASLHPLASRTFTDSTELLEGKHCLE